MDINPPEGSTKIEDQMCSSSLNIGLEQMAFIAGNSIIIDCVLILKLFD